MSFLAAIGSAVAGSLVSGLLQDDEPSGPGKEAIKEDTHILENLRKAGDLNLAGINQFMSSILGNTASQYSKQAAMNDVQGAIANLFREYSIKALPTIFQAEASSGGYNSTTGQLLANDAYAATVSKGAQLMIDAIDKYRRLQQGDYQGLANLVAAMPRSGGAGAAAAGMKSPTNPMNDLLVQGASSLGGALGQGLSDSFDRWQHMQGLPSWAAGNSGMAD